MSQHSGRVTLLVRDYDEAIGFYVGRLGFELVSDAPQEAKRWVEVRPPGAETGLLLAQAAGPKQTDMIGRQGGGRVFLFLQTDDFWRDHTRGRGVRGLLREPVGPDRAPRVTPGSARQPGVQAP